MNERFIIHKANQSFDATSLTIVEEILFAAMNIISWNGSSLPFSPVIYYCLVTEVVEMVKEV